MELIENRKETKDINRFVTSEMSTILNKVSLESVYKNARDIFEQKQRGSYAQVNFDWILIQNEAKQSSKFFF